MQRELLLGLCRCIVLLFGLCRCIALLLSLCRCIALLLSLCRCIVLLLAGSFADFVAARFFFVLLFFGRHHPKLFVLIHQIHEGGNQKRESIIHRLFSISPYKHSLLMIPSNSCTCWKIGEFRFRFVAVSSSFFRPHCTNVT